MGLFLMVLGFMWWWPLGLIILAALSERPDRIPAIGNRSDRWIGAVATGDARFQKLLRRRPLAAENLEQSVERRRDHGTVFR